MNLGKKTVEKKVLKKQIPIVFSTDNGFALYCYVAIDSLIRHANPDFRYEIFVFESGIELRNKTLLESLTNEYVNVKCVEIDQYVANVKLKASLHLTVETYYRLFIPMILPDFPKVLYLDSDMVIMDDISQLFCMDLKGKAIGVVEEIPAGHVLEHAEEIGRDDSRIMFNAGMLLLDTKVFEKERIREKCLEELNKDYSRPIRLLKLADQDALNIVLCDNVTWIDRRWNYQIQYLDKTDTIREDYRTEYIKAAETAAIYHFAGGTKPWNTPKLPKAEVFWNAVEKTPVLIELITQEILKSQQRGDKVTCYEKWRFPYEEVSAGSRIVLYGAGRIGRDFWQQMKISEYAQVVLWIDRAWEVMHDESIKSIENIDKTEFDYVVIAIERGRIAGEVSDELLRHGVSREKIVWRNYRKEK